MSSQSITFVSSPGVPEASGGGRQRALKWAAVFVFWTSFGILNASQLYLGLRSEGMRDHSFGRMFAWQIAGWWFWAAATPLVLWLGRRFPFERAAIARSLPVHAAACVAVSAAYTLYAASLMLALRPWGAATNPPPFAALFFGRLLSQFHIDLLIYFAIVGVGVALGYYARLRERERQAAQLEARLAEAQLEALRAQLHPHFLFNTLNGIAALVREGSNRAAVDMLAGLSDLLRHALANAGRQEVPLREEVEFLELYLGIQQMRFRDRLRVQIDAAPDALDALVPNLILQPLVENAVRHGVAARDRVCTVVVGARRDRDQLHLTVSDDGPGLPDYLPPGREGGIGLKNTRARLAQLYGPAHTFAISNRAEGGGVEAALTLPLRLASEVKDDG